jgi:hypothetical protein
VSVFSFVTGRAELNPASISADAIKIVEGRISKNGGMDKTFLELEAVS